MKSIIVTTFFILFLASCDKSTSAFNQSLDCDLIVGCEIGQMGLHLDVQLPAQIAPEKLFEIEINFTQSVSNVESKLEGITMYMGVVPVFLTATNNPQQYRAQTLLGLCAEETMLWRLTVSWQHQGKSFKTYQIIEVKHSRAS